MPFLLWQSLLARVRQSLGGASFIGVCVFGLVGGRLKFSLFVDHQKGLDLVVSLPCPA